MTKIYELMHLLAGFEAGAEVKIKIESPEELKAIFKKTDFTVDNVQRNGPFIKLTLRELEG